MRTVADKTLIVLSLEMYSVVTRLLEYSGRSGNEAIKLNDILFRVSRKDMKNILLDVQFNNASYKFNFQNNGWISIQEITDNKNTERFSMGFFRDDHNFTYSGDRDFCVEVCERLIDIIKKGFNFK